MIIYKLEYRLLGKRAWHRLSVSARIPFTAADSEKYSHMLADRHMVSWLDVELRQIEVQS